MCIPKTLVDEVESSKVEQTTRVQRCFAAYGIEVAGRQAKPQRRMEAELRSDRTLTLAVAAREYIWLYDRQHGAGISEIAAREGLPVDRVKYGLMRARALDKKTSRDSRTGPSGLVADIAHAPRLIPLFPIGPYTPQSACPHLQPIEPGSTLCCMVCHSSGMDAHPALRRDPRTDPAPEPEAETAAKRDLPREAGELHETRKQRRRRMFAQQTVTAPGGPE
jgi:hypothetical protein